MKKKVIIKKPKEKKVHPKPKERIKEPKSNIGFAALIRKNIPKLSGSGLLKKKSEEKELNKHPESRKKLKEEKADKRGKNE